jgi:Fur family ferric uptake transcriptional regulator
LAVERADVADELRAEGLRVTAPRVAVLAGLREHGEHLPVDEIVERVRVRLHAVSLQAVYNGLAALAGAGLVRRVEPAGRRALFEARVGDNHHHVVCRLCGALTDVDCVMGEAPCLEPSDTGGFLIDEAEVTFWGLCPGCQKTDREASL